MVSKVKYDTVPKISRKTVRKEPWKYVFLALAVVVVFATGGGAILPLLFLFIVLGLVRYASNLISRMLKPAITHEEDEEEIGPTPVDRF
jgi:hypothetical protein